MQSFRMLASDAARFRRNVSLVSKFFAIKKVSQIDVKTVNKKMLSRYLVLGLNKLGAQIVKQTSNLWLNIL